MRKTKTILTTGRIYSNERKTSKATIVRAEKIEVVSVRRYRAGYEVRTEIRDLEKPGDRAWTFKAAYTPSGAFIGSPRSAHRIVAKHGIAPELRTPDSQTCSIGFRKRDQKWFGWSHRAMCGFGIGDKIFTERFGDDNTPYTKHGKRTIKTLGDAKLAAKRFAASVS